MTTPVNFVSGRRPDGTSILAVRGEIDLSNAGAFAAELADALPGRGRLVVDLTEVTYLDSSGLTALFAQASHIEVEVTSLLTPTLEIVGLSDVTLVRERDARPPDREPG